MTVCSTNNHVSFNTSVRYLEEKCSKSRHKQQSIITKYYLTTDVFIGETNNHAVLRGVVLVLVLNYKTTSGIVICLSLTTPAELDLKPLEVSFVLYHFNKTL